VYLKCLTTCIIYLHTLQTDIHTPADTPLWVSELYPNQNRFNVSLREPCHHGMLCHQRILRQKTNVALKKQIKHLVSQRLCSLNIYFNCTVFNNINMYIWSVEIAFLLSLGAFPIYIYIYLIKFFKYVISYIVLVYKCSVLYLYVLRGSSYCRVAAACAVGDPNKLNTRRLTDDDRAGSCQGADANEIKKTHCYHSFPWPYTGVILWA
jgi:hypothetical protein